MTSSSLFNAPAEKPTGRAVRIPADGGDTFDFGGLGVHWKIEADATGGRFSVVHHPLAPHALAAPLHRHRNEDEYSYVLEGKLGALLGHEVVVRKPGAGFSSRADSGTRSGTRAIPRATSSR